MGEIKKFALSGNGGNIPIMKDYINIKVWKKTRNRLRLLAALLEKSMLECLDDLVEEKMKELEKEKSDQK